MCSKTRLDDLQCRCDIAYRAELQGPSAGPQLYQAREDMPFKLDGPVGPSCPKVFIQHPRVPLGFMCLARVRL